MEVLSEAGRWQ